MRARLVVDLLLAGLLSGCAKYYDAHPEKGYTGFELNSGIARSSAPVADV
jgi:hypothetical protein